MESDFQEKIKLAQNKGFGLLEIVSLVFLFFFFFFLHEFV